MQALHSSCEIEDVAEAHTCKKFRGTPIARVTVCVFRHQGYIYIYIIYIYVLVGESPLMLASAWVSRVAFIQNSVILH